MMNRRFSVWKNIDITAVTLYLSIVVCGLVNVYAAVYSFDMDNASFLYSRFGKQVLWASLSLAVGFLFLKIHSYFYDNFSLLVYFLILILLIITPFLAHNIKGSLSWITIGPFSFQIAEVAKCATALAVSSYLGRFAMSNNRYNKFLIPFAFVLMPFIIIAFLQHDMGTALVFFSFIFVFYRLGISSYIPIIGLLILLTFISSIRFSPIITIIILTLLFAAWIIIRFRRKLYIPLIKTAVTFLFLLSLTFLSDYAFNHFLRVHQQRRIELILGMSEDVKGVGYNIHQAKIAIGSGGFTGKGFLQGTQNKLNYVPEQETDFIFCTLGEEWGFLGTLTVLLLYFFLLWRLQSMAERQKSVFSFTFIYSVWGIFFFHVIINIGMVLGLSPVIGIPLPFFSYGGSSFLCSTIMLFICLRLDAEQTDKM